MVCMTGNAIFLVNEVGEKTQVRFGSLEKQRSTDAVCLAGCIFNILTRVNDFLTLRNQFQRAFSMGRNLNVLAFLIKS